MKKLLLSIMAFVYLFSSVGATIHMHYCMNKLVSWSFAEKQTDENSCSNCGMYRSATDKYCYKETKGCCSDEQKQIAITADQQPTETGLYLAPAPAEAVPLPYLYNVFNIDFSLPKHYPLTKASHPIGSLSLFIRNCVFRI